MIKRTIASTKLAEEDELVLVELCDTMDYVVLQSHAGYFLRFLKEEVPEKKKAALGVRAMKMGDRDYLEHAYLLERPGWNTRLNTKKSRWSSIRSSLENGTPKERKCGYKGKSLKTLAFYNNKWYDYHVNR